MTTPKVGAALVACAATLGACGLGLSATLSARAARPAPVRFVAVGDAGRGDPAQHAVAAAMATVCAQRGCDGVLYLGDNFYDDGVESVDDPEFQSKFEAPYAAIDLPFYVVNGNHDLAADGTDYQAWKADLYVRYTDLSDKWTMPAPWYTARIRDVELFALDTTQALYANVDAQGAWLEEALDTSDARWRIVLGHHPFRSNGEHGDVREPLGSMLDRVLCGRADLYVGAHDHTLQWLQPVCGLEVLVSGAGASTTSLVGGANPARYQSDDHVGFVWIELDGERMTAAFYDSGARQLYTDTVVR